MALSKTGRFLNKAEILGVGVFSPLSRFKIPAKFSWTQKETGRLFPVLVVQFSGKKKEPKRKRLVRISFGGVGVFHVQGWGSKSLVCPSKPRETKLFGGISRDFRRDVPGAPEKFEKKRLVFNFGSLNFEM